MKNIGLIVALLVIAAIGYSESGNPTSNVLYDSANTASTLLWRDSSGNVAFGADATSNSFHVPGVSSAALNAITPTRIGDVWWIINLGRTTPAFQCVSTGTTLGAIALSTNTTSPCITVK